MPCRLQSVLEATTGSIRQVFKGPLASRLARCCSGIEQNIRRDGVVSLLPIPAWHVYAFVVAVDGKEQQVIVVERPKTLKRLGTKRAYGWDEFMKRLLAHPPIDALNSGTDVAGATISR